MRTFTGNERSQMFDHYMICITGRKTGQINGLESAFVYRNGTNHSDYHNVSYVPYFLDEVDNQTLRAEALRKCGGDASRVQCIFDYIFTDEQVAEQTLNKDKQQQAAAREIGEFVGQI